MRLDRFLSRATGWSRRQADAAIRAGEVRVNGEACRNPASRLADNAQVEHAGRLIAQPRARYYMLNKPRDYVCANRDSQHRTVFQLLATSTTRGLNVAGRLDRDATGLVLLTDDGQWLHRVTSPRVGHLKIYRVTLADSLSAAAVEALAAGIRLRGEAKPCLPVELSGIGPLDWRIALREGRYHQIKRMFAAVGNQVNALHREAIGGVVLDPALPSGASRALHKAEIACFADARETTTQGKFIPS